MLEAVIEIAGFGVGSSRSMAVMAPVPKGQFFHLLTTAVIQHPHATVPIVLVTTSDQAAFQYLKGFAVGGHENVDHRPPVAALPLFFQLVDCASTVGEATPGQPQRQQARQQQPGFRYQQQQAQSCAQVRAQVEAAGDSPVQIPGCQQADQHNQAASLPDGALLLRLFPQPKGPHQQHQWQPVQANCSCCC